MSRNNISRLFTIDFWIYKSSTPSHDEDIISIGVNNEISPGGMPLHIYIENGSGGGEYRIRGSIFNGSGGNESWIGPDFRPLLNKWVHVAFVRNNGTATLYINGVSEASRANSANLSTNKVFIGGDTTNEPSRFYQGYLDELHIRNTAVYTQNFTPPNHAFGKQPINTVETSDYYNAKSELK